MAQIFHRSTNTISRVSIFGAVFIVAALACRKPELPLDRLRADLLRHGRPSVADRRVEVDYVFDRLGENYLGQAYRILVPERRKGREGVDENDHGSDLSTSLHRFAERGGDDR